MTTALSGTDDREWDRYVESHPEGTVDHLVGWRSVLERAFSQSCTYLIARRDGAVVGVLPLVRFRSRVFGRFLVSLPFLNYGGLLSDGDETARALVAAATETARAFGASHLELRHQRRQMSSLPCREHKLSMRRELPAAVDTLWAQIDRKVRNQVRKAQKEGLAAEDGGLDLVDEFYSVFAENMRDLGTPVFGKAVFVETLRQFPERARIFVVRRGTRVIAGSLTVAAGGSVLVPWASALREFRAFCPNMLLYWSMLEAATLQGARTFDFGRSSPGGGTHQFKLQWGARETTQCWEYVLLTRDEPPNQGPSNPRFRLAIAAWQKLPLWAANAIGPRLANSLP